MKTTEMKKTGKANHYAIVTYHPAVYTDTTLFLFENGRFFTDEEMENYIYWFLKHSGLIPEEIRLRVSLEECQDIRAKDKYVEWNTCSRPYFKHLVQAGAFHTGYYEEDENGTT